MSIQKTFDMEEQYNIILPKVGCKICGREFEIITSTHLKIHGITFDEYREQFPDALLASEGWYKKQRESHLGKHHTEESKQKMREAQSGKHLTEEHKQKLREVRLGKPSPLKGKHLSENHKQKIK